MSGGKVAEETIRYVVESVIDTAAGTTGYLRSSGDSAEPWRNERQAYFSAEEARIIDNMMLGIALPEDGSPGYVEGAEGDLGLGDGSRGTYDLEARQGEGTGSASDPTARGGPGGVASQGKLKPSSVKEAPGRTSLARRVRMAIKRSIMRSNKAVPSMRFPQMVACGMVFVSRAITRRPLLNAASFVAAR